MPKRGRERLIYIFVFLLLIGVGFGRLLGVSVSFPALADEGNVEESQQAVSSTIEEEKPAGKTTEEPVFMVYVDGSVKKPGLYTMRADARVQDALEAAGGVKKDADLSPVNPAMRLSDEMKITVPSKKEAKKGQTSVPVFVAGSSDLKESTTDRKASTPGKGANLIDLNTADQALLETLPSIGAAKAKSIISYREQHPFSSIEQLKEVKGIGEKLFEKLRPLVTVQ